MASAQHHSYALYRSYRAMAWRDRHGGARRRSIWHNVAWRSESRAGNGMPSRRENRAYQGGDSGGAARKNEHRHRAAGNVDAYVAAWRHRRRHLAHRLSRLRNIICSSCSASSPAAYHTAYYKHYQQRVASSSVSANSNQRAAYRKAYDIIGVWRR